MAQASLIQCSQCKESKPPESFWPSQIFRIKSSGVCKRCHKALNAESQRRVRSKKCIVEGCTRCQQCRGLCGHHYKNSPLRRKRSGISTGLLTSCSVESCGLPVVAKGLCAAHYRRLQEFGVVSGMTPKYAEALERRKSGVIDDSGYRMGLVPRPFSGDASLWYVGIGASQGHGRESR